MAGRREGDGIAVPVGRGLVAHGDVQVRHTGYIERVFSPSNDMAQFELIDGGGRSYVCRVRGEAEVDFAKRHCSKGSTLTILGRSAGFSWDEWNGPAHLTRQTGTEIAVLGMQEELPKPEPEPDRLDLKALFDRRSDRGTPR